MEGRRLRQNKFPSNQKKSKKNLKKHIVFVSSLVAVIAAVQVSATCATGQIPVSGNE